MNDKAAIAFGAEVIEDKVEPKAELQPLKEFKSVISNVTVSKATLVRIAITHDDDCPGGVKCICEPHVARHMRWTDEVDFGARKATRTPDGILGNKGNKDWTWTPSAALEYSDELLNEFANREWVELPTAEVKKGG